MKLDWRDISREEWESMIARFCRARKPKVAEMEWPSGWHGVLNMSALKQRLNRHG